jgi:hypothetical protein
MHRTRALGVVSALGAVAALACGAASVEEQTLLRFFVAARTLDSTVVRKYATIDFNPRSEGTVQTFSVKAVGPERQARKEVTIEAVVLDPQGMTAQRTLVATFEKVEGRWLITGLRQTPASQTSREASSAPPN